MEKWTVLLTFPWQPFSHWSNPAFQQLTTSGSILNYQFGFTGVNLLPTITTLISMMGGTMLAIWLGELISEYGIPNQGLSLIIFAGIVSRIPVNLYSLIISGQNVALALILMAVVLALTIFAIIIVQQGRRNVPVLFPWTPCREPHVHAGKVQSAFDGQPGRNDSADLCANHSFAARHYRAILYQFENPVVRIL